MEVQLEADNSERHVRSPAAVTWAVWKALFLRELLARLTAGRAAWVWMLLEPVAHVAFLMLLYATIRQREPFGVPGPLFIMTGVLNFFMMRNTFSRCTDAAAANAPFFTYRQVKPVDTVIVRAAVEGFLYIIVATLLFTSIGVISYPSIPDDPLFALIAFALMWLAGAGMGLVFSAFSSLVPEIGKTVKMLNRPLYIASCVVFPSMLIPQPYQDWVMFNPFAHGVESMRAAFFPIYKVAPQTSLIYLAFFAQVTVFFGLVLHIRFAKRFKER
jgi:capsular polysaccharide transport system permease protein